MRDPFLRSFQLFVSSRDSWLLRVRENLRLLVASGPMFPSSANGAPLHLVRNARTANSNQGQAASLLTHGALAVGLMLLCSPSERRPDGGPGRDQPHSGPVVYFHEFVAPEFGKPGLGKDSGGGEEDPRLARHGLFPPGSSLPLAPPRRMATSPVEMPVPVSVFDENATPSPPIVTNLGIPWMKEDSDSAGPGKRHGFGSGIDGGMGDKVGPGAGQGERYDGPYKNVVSIPRCEYCPDPPYTDEARQAKLQGSVTLEVLVNPEGRAARIRVLQGIGLGLEERALETIRGWKFVPARDGLRRAVPSWVTIEVFFRLF